MHDSAGIPAWDAGERSVRLADAVKALHALHAWEAGRAKHCMLLTGRSGTEGGKDGPDPKEMYCSDQRKTDPDEMNWDYVRISNLTLDETSEKQFHNTEKWGVPMLCQEASTSKLKCVFDGTEP